MKRRLRPRFIPVQGTAPRARRLAGGAPAQGQLTESRKTRMTAATGRVRRQTAIVRLLLDSLAGAYAHGLPAGGALLDAMRQLDDLDLLVRELAGAPRRRRAYVAFDAQLTSEVEGCAAYAARSRGVRLVVGRIDAATPPILCDPEAAESAVRFLLLVALSRSRGGGEVEVQLLAGMRGVTVVAGYEPGPDALRTFAVEDPALRRLREDAARLRGEVRIGSGPPGAVAVRLLIPVTRAAASAPREPSPPSAD